jgi:hypothetical protein
MYYVACVECKKKVQQDNGGYRCEKCGKIVNTYVNLTLTAKILDMSGGLWVSFIGEQAEKLLGMPSQDFKKFRETHSVEQIKDLLN